MKFLHATLLFVVTFFTLSASAEIIEVKHLTDLKKQLKPETLVIFDLDNTLMEPVQDLGTDHWGSYQIQKYMKQGLSKEAACKKVQFEWMAVQNITQVKPVEPSTPKLIEELQKSGYQMIGLTGRSQEMSALTTHQLDAIGVDLNKTAPNKEDVLFKSDQTLLKSFPWVLYHHGTIFTARMDKGKALFTLLDKVGCSPKRIVFADDKRSALEQVEKACQERKIPFVGLRYGFTDEKVNNFDPTAAEKQYSHFVNILSNKEALSQK